ncbi:MAG: autotransporter outer rane beta-barrel protein [Verrucomicrobia bacterium]|nr:autotransporter outer rane beta-barrel protein [Verrucomicrobiota bacterium]
MTSHRLSLVRRIFCAGLAALAVGGSALQAQTHISGTQSSPIVGDIIIDPGLTATFDPGASFSGANATFSSTSTFNWNQVGALTGKTITLGTNVNIQVLTGQSLTFGAGSSMTGTLLNFFGVGGAAFINQGTINQTTSGGSINMPTFTNAAGGLITVSGGGYLTFQGTTVTNNGTISATGFNNNLIFYTMNNLGLVTGDNGASIVFQGTGFTTANLGTIQLSNGAQALIVGSINNSSATLAAPTGGAFQLYGGTVTGGTINNNALQFTTNGGFLDGATLVGDLNLVTTSASVTFKNAATFTGTNLNLASSAYLYWQQATALSNKALTFAGNSLIYVSGVNNTLTLGAGTTATGQIQIYSDGSTGTAITNQGSITHTFGSGNIYATSFTNSGSITATNGLLYLGYPSASYVSTNTGTITADGSSTTVYIRGPFDNNGTLTAQNSGVLIFDGANTSANLGNVVITGSGRALLNGVIDNTSSTLPSVSGGTFELYGGTITGGTVPSSALLFTTSSGYLDGVSITGDLNLPTTGSYVYFRSGTGFTGANVNFGTSSSLYWQQVGTLSGKALTFASNAYLYINGVNNTLTLASGSTATGSVSIYSDGSVGTAFTNQGAIAFTSGSGSIYAANFTNSGTVMATGGVLYLGYPSVPYAATNTGSVTSDGSSTTVYIRGDFDNNGTLTAQNSGQLIFDGNNTSANLGSVVLASGGRALLNGTINNASASLPAPTGGVFELYGGTIIGGTVSPSALHFTTSAGTLDNVSILGDLDLPTVNSYFYLKNGTNFTGTNANLGASTALYWQQVGTLTGKALTFGANSYIYVNGINNTLTLGPGSTATGAVSIYSDGSTGTAITNQGAITYNGSSGSIYAVNFTNAGSILASAGTLYLGYPNAVYNATNTGSVTSDGAGTYVYIRGNFDNNGTLTAQNSGILRFDGNTTTANLGSITISSGGAVQLNGLVDNTAATITAPTGGSYDLLGGTIVGGTIAAGAVNFTTSAGTLDGVSLLGDLSLLAPSAYVRLANGTSFSGANLNLTSSAGIYWQQVGTLAGKNLNLGSNSYIYLTGVNNALTLANTTTVNGDASIYSDGSTGIVLNLQGAINHTLGNGTLSAPTLTNSGTITSTTGMLTVGSVSAGYSTVNTGSIIADGSSTSVYIYGNFDNNGTLSAQNSAQLLFYGDNTTANLGSVQIASGGRALLNGVLDNTAATLNTIIGGNFELYGGTVNNGTVAPGALAFTSSGGVLSNVALSGDISANAGAYAEFRNGTNFTGANATLNTSAGIYWEQVGSLVGKSISLGSGAYLYVSGVNNSLTIDPTTTITGTANIYSDGNSGTTIVNLGTINQTLGGGSLYARSFTNSGTINLTTGTNYLGYASAGYTFDNTASGTITVNGATTYLQVPLNNLGVMNVQSGTLVTSGNLTNGSTGTLKGSGSVLGDVTIAGGMLTPGNSVGTLTFNSGNFAVTGASVFGIEISGATADKALFLGPTSNVDIGAGLLTLSVSLLTAPTPGTTYSIMSISGGSNVFNGYFAGLPSTGSSFIATLGLQDYQFTVSYLANTINLDFMPVPEPSTYVLVGAGLAMLVAARLRRRRA